MEAIQKMAWGGLLRICWALTLCQVLCNTEKRDIVLTEFFLFDGENTIKHIIAILCDVIVEGTVRTNWIGTFI